MPAAAAGWYKFAANPGDASGTSLIAALGDPRRTIMALAFFDGHTHEQFSTMRAMPLGT